MDHNQQHFDLSKTTKPDGFHIAFIEPKGGTPSKQMQMAYELCEKHAIASWVTLDESTQISRKSVFVCQEFAGHDFEKLRSFKVRIFGPQYIISYLKNNECIPVVSHPVYTATMRGLKVCCSSISQNLREDIHEKIQLMGGIVHRQFTEVVTHLVAGEVGSKKYHVACHYNVEVMLPEWVFNCWEVGKEEIIHASDKRFNKFYCPVFKGLNITVSQFDAVERKKIQELVQSNGGTYSGDLRANATTHLILLEPSGSKYKVAKQKSIHCVKPSWLYESIEKGICLDADLHRLESRPISQKTLSSTLRDGINACLPNISSVSAISCYSGVNETTFSRDNAFNPDGSSDIALPVKPDFKDSNLLNKLENCNYHSSGLFLDGCKIIVSGFTADVTEKLRKILNAGGATRFDQICDAVSHVILGDEVDELRNTLLNGQFRPHVVNIDWLLACVDAGRPVDEMKYCSLDLNSKVEAISPFSNTSKTILKNSRNQTKCSPSRSVSRHLQLDDLSDVMSQYMANVEVSAVEDKLFNGSVFMVFGFNEVELEEIKCLIVENGGTLYASDDDHILDFAVVPVQGFSVPVQACNVVTNFWLVTCIANDALQDVAAHPLYRPVCVNTKSQPLQGCVITMSQFLHQERDCLIQIATLLGAKYQDCFSRLNHSARGLLASTHLIAMLPEGSKYQGALKWGLPVVSMQWLIKCAESGCRLEEEAFTIGEIGQNMKSKSENLNVSLAQKNNEDHLKVPKIPAEPLALADNANVEVDSKTPLANSTFRSPASGYPSTSERLLQIQERLRTGYQTPSLHLGRVKQLMLEECDKSADTSSDSPGPDTPNKFLDPSINYKSQINIRDAMAALDSPLTKRTSLDDASPSNLPIEDLFALRIKQALTYQLKTTGGVALKDSDDSLDEDFVKKVPLLGVVIVVSKKLSHRQIELNNIAEELGAKYRWKYDKACTHFIHEGKPSELNKEMKLAVEEGKVIVSPEWLYACKEKQMRVEEHLYPYSYNPQLLLNVHLLKGSSPAKNEISTTPKKTSSASTSLTGSSIDNSNFGKEMQSKENEVEEIRENACRKIDELLAATRVAKNKRKNRLGNGSGIYSSFIEGSSRKMVKPQRRKQETTNENMEENCESVPITWDDPTSRLERQKLAAKLAKDSQSVDMNFIEVAAERTEEKDSSKDKLSTDGIQDKIKVCPQSLPRIMLAGFKTQQRLEYGAIVTKLGGIFLNSEQFDPSCTHLIVGNPSRSEKYLASVASGKWILEMSYIKACEDAGNFVEEKEFEFGREENKHLMSLNEQQQILAKAAHHWRVNLQQKRATNNKVGAFTDWKVIVYSNEARSSSFKRLLEAGSADIADVRPPFTEVTGVTHAFIELSYVETPNIDLLALLNSGTKCIKPEYIGHFLTEEQPSSVSNFYIREVIPLLESCNSTDNGHIKRKSDETFGNNKRSRQ